MGECSGTTFDFTTRGDRAHDERYKITLVDPRKMQYMVKTGFRNFSSSILSLGINVKMGTRSPKELENDATIHISAHGTTSTRGRDELWEDFFSQAGGVGL